MSIADAARVLSKVGGQTIEPEMLQEDIDDGAPTNPDGTINLIHYASWLVREMAQRAN